METYQDFLNRINAFEKCEIYLGEDYFYGNPSIAKKVNPDNSFRDFFGDTVVFDLDITTKEKLKKWIDNLYNEVPECFCERLTMDTFHMTLHDLSNGENLTDIAADVFVNELRIREISKEIKGFENIKMRSKYIFNMVNTSLVLGLYPADDAEYQKLMKLYHVFDAVKKLEYPMTPHITLAYYNINGFDTKSARKLETLVKEINTCQLDKPLEVELDSRVLYYQRFCSMNDYTNIFNLKQE